MQPVRARAEAFVELWLARALPPRDSAPARLHAAMHDAVFDGAARAHARVCRMVAERCGGASDELLGRMAAAVELVHCAWRVQDVSALSILAGDALLTCAFESLCQVPPAHAAVAMRLTAVLARAAGSTGLLGGRESELMRAAAIGGAICCGIEDDLEAWGDLGVSMIALQP
jgi:geranylgeranyl pyrophosphate synthase